MDKLSEARQLDRFIRQMKWTLIACLALLVVPLAIYAVYLDRRLDSFEDDLRYRPPQADGQPPLTDGNADSAGELSTSPVEGQTVYVPAYSHIYHQDGKPHLLTVTLSVRNTDATHEIVLTSVRYYDTKGREIRSHLEKRLRIAPLATAEFLVERDDPTGGSGASFIVKWVANAGVTQPVIETVMIDTSGQQGISFARPGTVVSEKLPEGVNGADVPVSATGRQGDE